MKIKLFALLLCGISFAGYFSITPGGGGSGDVVGPASSINLSIPHYSGTTGKLIADSGDFFIDSTRNFMYTNSASYGSYLASPDTALESYKTWRAGLALSTDVSRIFYTANPTASKAVWLGSTAASSAAFIGLTMWDDTAEVLSLIGMLDADGAGSAWGPYSYQYGTQDILFTRSTSNVSAGLNSGLSSQYFLKNGSIVLRDQGGSAISSIVALKPAASYTSGTAAYFNYEGVRYADDTAADAVKADSTTYAARNKAAGTGDGGDINLSPGTSVGGAEGVVTVNGNLTMVAAQAASAYDDNAGTGSVTAFTFNFNTGNVQSIDLEDFSGNVTATLSNPLAGASYVIKVIQGTGIYDIVWPASVKWANSAAPVITATNNKVDIISLVYDGTDYYGSYSQNH